MRSFVHDVPASRVIFGNGAIDSMGVKVDHLGCSRVLLIGSDRDSRRDVDGHLGRHLVARFTDISAHVPADVARAAIDLATAEAVDVVVAFGGGSAIGFAKAVAKSTGLPVVAVPTTYSGSEMTPIWGVTENRRKATGVDRAVLPRTVIYDPELTVSLPAAISATSGMNALAHLVEGLYAADASPLSSLQAEEGVWALARALPMVVDRLDDLSARGDALYGSWLAGWTLGTTTMGVHQRACLVLGGAYDLPPHGATHSALLPHAAAFNAASSPVAMAAITRSLEAAGIDAPDAASGIWNLADVIGAPTSLKSVGLRRDEIDDAAVLIVDGEPVNPRPVSLDCVRQLLLDAYEGRRPDARSGGPGT